MLTARGKKSAPWSLGLKRPFANAHLTRKDVQDELGVAQAGVGEQIVGQRSGDLALESALQRTGAIARVEATALIVGHSASQPPTSPPASRQSRTGAEI